MLIKPFKVPRIRKKRKVRLRKRKRPSLIVSGISSIIDSIAGIFRPYVKGWLGETAMDIQLSYRLSDEYHTISNVILPTESGTTQIDHLVISPYGIFVVENKNYTGWIYGDDQSREWTQTFYKNKYKFMNPIHQNYAHVKAIESRMTDYPNVPIIPIIAFSGDCRLKVSTNHHVVYYKQVRKVIKSYTNKLLSPQEVTQILFDLQQEGAKYAGSSQEHIQNVNYKKACVKNASAGEKCPRCGNGFMKVRKGTGGYFLGCSNYPKCRFTKQYGGR